MTVDLALVLLAALDGVVDEATARAWMTSAGPDGVTPLALAAIDLPAAVTAARRYADEHGADLLTIGYETGVRSAWMVVIAAVDEGDGGTASWATGTCSETLDQLEQLLEPLPGQAVTVTCGRCGDTATDVTVGLDAAGWWRRPIARDMRCPACRTRLRDHCRECGAQVSHYSGWGTDTERPECSVSSDHDA